MRLKKVWISEYKNLKDFTLELKEDNFLEIFVGKNASGKSNLFEAIALIFKHLSEFRQGESTSIEFDYEIEYQLGRKSISFKSVAGEISWKDERIKNGHNIILTNLPDKIIFYYSGHSSNVESILFESIQFLQHSSQDEELQHRIALQSDADNSNFERNFDHIFSDIKILGIDETDINIILLAILLQEDELPTKQYLLRYLGIKDLEGVLHLTLQKPFYMRPLHHRHNGLQRYDGSITYAPLPSLDPPIDRLDETTHYWHLRGKLKDFLNIFVAANLEDSIHRTEGYQEALEEWSIYSDTEKLKDKLKAYSPFELFEAFSSLKIIGMFKSLSFNLQLNNGEIINSKGFSDGQLQTLYIFALTEIFKDQRTLMLLDEPDSFLHPEWQYQFLDQINEISDQAQKSNHILMSSHSAITMINHLQKQINYIDLKDNYANCYPLPKHLAIEWLSADMIRYAEEEQLLSIINTIQIEDKAVLFVEGITDPIILKEAWMRLYPKEKMPFIPMFAFGHTFIPRLLNDENIYREIGENGLFALFDFDEAFDSWNGLKRNTDSKFEEDPYRGLGIEINRHNKQAYAFMMPLPKTEALKGQIFNSKGEHFKNRTLCEIEHLFYGEETEHFFEEREMPGGGKTIHFKGDKVKGKKVQFAKEFIPTLDQSYFEIFHPMFNKIKSVIKLPIK